MYLALIHIDLFANLLRYGEVILPEYSVSDEISDESQIPGALLKILRSGNPIEYPSQYIIAEYDCSTEKRHELQIGSVKELIATNAEGKRSFSSQFRDDLIIQDGKYQDIFQEYLDGFQKQEIKKGIVHFRKRCGLDELDNYDEYVELIYKGITNRIKYRHHYQLPPDMRDEPYTLMISYDRYAPYPKGYAGYFCDVIESYYYHVHNDLMLEENVIERGTKIYSRIIEHQKNKPEEIVNAIKEEPFTQKCNEFYSKQGGYLVPFIFFVLRDQLRKSESFEFKEHSKLIAEMKALSKEAFDTASIFIGGYFGYRKFYDDYNTMSRFPIFKNSIENETNSDGIKQLTETDAVSTPNEDGKHKVKAPKTQSSTANDPVSDGDKQDSNSIQQESNVFNDGTEALYKEMRDIINENFKKTNEIASILNGLSKYKDNCEKLEEIKELFLNQEENKEKIKTLLGLKRWSSKINEIRDLIRKYFENK